MKIPVSFRIKRWLPFQEDYPRKVMEKMLPAILNEIDEKLKPYDCED
jgi:hypothetical protein